MVNILVSDGSSVKNPGPGGSAYAVINTNSGKVIIKSYHCGSTTNNIMELSGMIYGLKEHKSIKIIYTDSMYVVNGINTWIKNWKRNDWKTAAKQSVKNMELWMQLDELISVARPHVRWIKGHAKITNTMSTFERLLIAVQHEVDVYARKSATEQRDFVNEFENLSWIDVHHELNI